jgi:serine/threonine-protein kinase
VTAVEGSPLAPGYRLDRYEMLCPIATGGMAEVWVARLHGKHGFEKLVAIKSILPKYAEDPRFQQMFLDEARIASKIEHANVAQILDLGEEHHVLFLAMEWVDGESLSKLARAVERRGTRVPTPILARVLADTLGGLHAAHELRGDDGHLLGVVHRDISPQNILISTKGAAKLIDFGIAKARDRVAEDTNAGLLKGKIHYMAPEQANGSDVDRRADLWAIGATLYHLLTGRPPFEGENQLATLHLLTSGKRPAPLPPFVPRAVAEVVERSLAFDASERYATAADMQAALEHAMIESRSVATQADVARYVTEQLADRNRARREAVDLAVAAAKERARVDLLLRPGDRSSSIPASPAAAPSTVSGFPAANAPDSHPSSPTWGAVAVGSPSNAPPALPPRRRSLGVVLGMVAVGATSATLAAFGVSTYARNHEQAVAARPVVSAAVVATLASLPSPAPSASVAVTSLPIAIASGAGGSRAATAPSASGAVVPAWANGGWNRGGGGWPKPPLATPTGTATATGTATGTATTPKPVTPKGIDDGF